MDVSSDPEIEALKRQVAALRRQMVFVDHWRDTVSSRWWMRLWWFVQGFRLSCPGRWYRAPWNMSATKYEVRHGD